MRNRDSERWDDLCQLGSGRVKIQCWVSMTPESKALSHSALNCRERGDPLLKTVLAGGNTYGAHAAWNWMIRCNPLHWLLGSFQIFTFPSCCFFFLSQGRKSIQEKDNELMSAKLKVPIQKRTQSDSISLPRGTRRLLGLPNNFCFIFSSLKKIKIKWENSCFLVLESQESMIFVFAFQQNWDLPRC